MPTSFLVKKIMLDTEKKLAVCICSYRRPHLLKRLLEDIGAQSCLPEFVIVVDGDPASGDVQKMLTGLKGLDTELFYLPSNHPNQPYQRYLGWLVAEQKDASHLLYFDDDIHFLEIDVIEKIVLPLTWKCRRVVGVTANTISPNVERKLSAAPALRGQKFQSLSWLARWLGDGAGTPPGGLTPTGMRVEPDYTENEPYLRVEWLQGRVMAFRMSVLKRSSFSDDLFALKQIRAGKGEDTLISRTALSQGELLLARDVLIEHPDDDLPNSYPYEAYRYGFAVSYSRRLLNDHYRWPQKPRLSDRISLVKSYLGNSVLSWSRFILNPRAYKFRFAAGYTLGALRGLFQPPRAKYLTPEIDWDISAEEALLLLVTISLCREPK